MCSENEEELNPVISWKLWAYKSSLGRCCGILGCNNPPPFIKCEHCGNHYCKEHKIVLDITDAHGTK